MKKDFLNLGRQPIANSFLSSISKKSLNVCEDKNLEFIEFENSNLYIVKSTIIK